MRYEEQRIIYICIYICTYIQQLQISHFAFRDLLFACQISDLRFPILYFQFTASHYAFLLAGFGAQNRWFRFRVCDFGVYSYLQLRIARFAFRDLFFACRILDFRFPILYFQFTVSHYAFLFTGLGAQNRWFRFQICDFGMYSYLQLQVSHFTFRDLFLTWQISDFRFPILNFRLAASHYAFLLAAFRAQNRWFRFQVCDFGFLISHYNCSFRKCLGNRAFDSPDSKFSGQGNPPSSFPIPISRDVFAENLVNTVVFACFVQKTL